MDKNTLTGFILIAAVLIGFSYFSRPSEAEMEAQRRQDSIATVAQQKGRNRASGTSSFRHDVIVLRSQEGGSTGCRIGKRTD